MINVDYIKNLVEEMTRSEASSYASGDDFNREQRLAQSLLMDYHIRRFDHIDYESLSPFITEAPLMATNSEVVIPDDMRKLISSDVRVVTIVNGAAVTERYGANLVNAAAVAETRKSTIRGGNSAKNQYIYWLIGDSYRFEPTVSRVTFRYIKEPADAVWGYTADTVNDVENYDVSTSTDFLWMEKDTQNLVDIFCYLRGIRTRQSDLITWLQATNNLK